MVAVRLALLLAACGPSAQVRALRLNDAPAADDELAGIGFQIFYDARFSANQETRCATCHPPETFFADKTPHPRSSPTIFNAAREERWFWDARVDALWKQPEQALRNEMGMTDALLAERLAKSYPTLASFDDVGKALEAYMRKIASGPSRLDAFLDGDADALNDQEKDGLARFEAQGCIKCHGGPILGSATLNEEGIKTPSLRNVSRTAPYYHDGRFATLEDAINAHGTSHPTLVAFLRALDGAYPAPPWNNWPQK